MQHRICAIALGFIAIVTAGCHYHLLTAPVPSEMQTITLSSYDPYGQLTHAVRTELHLNNVTVDDDTKAESDTLPSLQIFNASESQVTTSVFQDGKTAEYQLTLIVQAQVLIPGNGYYPTNIKVYRSYFDNFMTALAKDAERDTLRQEMLQQAAQQLVRKLLTVPKEVDKTLNAKLTHQQQQAAL